MFWRSVEPIDAAHLPAGRRSVRFSSSLAGTFIGGESVEADSLNHAVVLFKSDVAGSAIISGTVDGNRAETVVSFRPALPDIIFLSPSVPQVKALDSASVRIQRAPAPNGGTGQREHARRIRGTRCGAGQVR